MPEIPKGQGYMQFRLIIDQAAALIQPFCAQYPSPLIGLTCFVPTNQDQTEQSSQDPFFEAK